MALKIALAGNPNCGKTTMFNALTGANQYVGNWPGVTVEKKEGRLRAGGKGSEEIIITDLPGIYSLSPYTLEEVVSRDYLVNEKPDAVINLVDATNIERNLYLTTQLLEIGIPVVLALNMSDLLEKSGIKIDKKKLGDQLGCAVVETSALKGTGLKEVVAEAVNAAKTKSWQTPAGIFSSCLEASVLRAEQQLPDSISMEQRRWYAIKLLERDQKITGQLKLPASAMAFVEEEIRMLEKEMDDDTESIITDERYGYIGTVVEKSEKKSGNKLSSSDKIDRVVTNRLLGIPIFAAVMFLVYYVSVSTVGSMATEWANDSFVGGVQEAVRNFLETVGTGALMTGVMAGWATGNYEAAGLIAPSMYFIGILAVLVSAIMLKKTKPFSGDTAPFVMELPAYHIPSAKTVLLHVWERLKGFIIKAGTILFLACVVMWALSTFGFGPDGFGVVEDGSKSLMALLGGFLAPVFAPLGFGTWQPVAASLSGFTAKEAIVSTMGVLANVDGELAEEASVVAGAVKTWFPSTAAAFSFLIFNLLDSPCLAAIATMAQQMQSRKWFWFAIIFQNVFAYAVSLCIYQIGTFALQGAFGPWTAVSFGILFFMLYMLFRPDPYKNTKILVRRSVAA